MEENAFKSNMSDYQTKMHFGSRMPRRKKFLLVISFCLFLLLLGIGHLYNLSRPPSDFPIGQIVQIPDGTSIQKAGTILAQAHVVRSPALFQTFAILFSGDKGIRSGAYAFASPLSVMSVASKLTGGIFGLGRAKITLPEGITVKEMGTTVASSLYQFNTAQFVSLAQPKEGFLFPDTYFFFQTTTPDQVVTALSMQFNKVLAPYQQEIAASKRSLHDIITMASLIEKETNGKDDYAMISGILWNRIDRHMRLQVDATFIYTLGKGRGDVTPDDIKQDTSAYNTYTHYGLPPTPIGNPGLQAILAALRPAKTDYLFYLHEKDGTIHYAKTFEAHKKNIQKYLK